MEKDESQNIVVFYFVVIQYNTLRETNAYFVENEQFVALSPDTRYPISYYGHYLHVPFPICGANFLNLPTSYYLTPNRRNTFQTGQISATGFDKKKLDKHTDKPIGTIVSSQHEAKRYLIASYREKIYLIASQVVYVVEKQFKI